jgi:hypothetical protein
VPGIQIQSEYVFDDGESFDYRLGKTTRCRFTCEYRKGALNVQVELEGIGHGPLNLSLVVYGEFSGVNLITRKGSLALSLTKAHWRFTGKALNVRRSAWVKID